MLMVRSGLVTIHDATVSTDILPSVTRILKPNTIRKIRTIILLGSGGSVEASSRSDEQACNE